MSPSLTPDPGGRRCDYRDCDLCTGCYHGRHSACSGSVRCPMTGVVKPCRCCPSLSSPALSGTTPNPAPTKE